MRSHADFVECSWEEDGLWVSFFAELDEDTEDVIALRVNDPVEFYRAVRLSCDSWIAEMEAARREYRSGIAEDQAMQWALDRIRGVEESDPHEGLREATDLARKAAKENR